MRCLSMCLWHMAVGVSVMHNAEETVYDLAEGDVGYWTKGICAHAHAHTRRGVVLALCVSVRLNHAVDDDGQKHHTPH